MGKKKGKKSRGPKEEQATGGQPVKESAQKVEVSGKEPTGPSLPQQQKKDVEPALRPGGGDTTAGPSQQPQGERSVTGGPSQQPQGGRFVLTGPTQQPQGERRKQRQSQKQPAHVAGMEGGQKKGQAERMPGVPPQSVSQAPQTGVQREHPPEGTPSYTAIPPATGQSSPPPPAQPPPPGVQGPWGQPAGPVPGSSVAPRAMGPRGMTPPSEAPAHGAAGQRGVTPPSEASAPGAVGQRGVTPASQASAPGAAGQRGVTPPSQAPAHGAAGQRGVTPPSEAPAPGAIGQREVTPPSQAPAPGAVGQREVTPPSQAPAHGAAGQRGVTPPSQASAPGAVGQRGVTPPSEASAPGAVGRRGVTPASQAQSTSRAPSGTVKKTANAGVAATSKGTALQIPKRNGCGTEGRKIMVETNYLSLDLSKLRSSVAYHYDVEFQPALPKRLLKYAMEEFRRKHFPNRHPAFDGRKNLYAAQELPEVSDTVNVNDEESQKVKEFKVTIKYATQINMQTLMTYMDRGSSVVPPQNAVQALDVVLRSARMSRGFVQVGRSFFSPPRGRVVDLSGGLEMWYGFFQSAVLGWKPFLNVDVAHKGFPKQQDVVSAIDEICRLPRPGEELDFYQKRDFQDFIRGLKIQYMIPNNPSSKRIYKVNDIADCAARLRFPLENGQLITVQEYFSRFKGVQLQYPHLPCLAVGGANRKTPIYYPAELCRVIGSQVINKKMNERQTSNMIRSAATNTDVRKGKIMDALNEVRLDAHPSIKEFGITIGDRFEKVPARILDAPQLEYRDNKTVNPSGGKWWASNFFASGTLGTWMILTLDGSVRDDVLRNFGEQMQRAGRTLGMTIPRPSIQALPRPRPDKLEDFFWRMKNSNIDLVVVVVPDKDSYVKVKQVAELTVGVLTQCIKSTTITNLKPATCSNILLKVNSKLNGINHLLAGVSKPRCLHSPTMIVGADVTHPPPGVYKPSVAAVCASNDPRAFSYNIQIRLQPPRVEIIQDMEAIIRAQLLYFYKSTSGYKPERIIFYRDGVSEGQFLQVLRSEVSAIRRACASLQPGYEPSVTFLVVQKRHHTRFFPTSDRDADGKNRNVPAGTVVDTQITHPTELDFFLASHASIQGVTRPTKYHLLWNDDDNMTTDEIERLTYYLCHLFSRCTRSVSYPAPTYNAHLAAYRAGVYLEGTNLNLENLAHEQRRYFESEVLKRIIADRPMYFV